MSDFTRRLPIYLLLDCSESMAGDAIEDMNAGIRTLVDALKSDPLAIETAWLSVITFSGYAKQLHPLTELLEFIVPKLSVRSGTALGSALRLLTECLTREIVKGSATQKADYKPLVILLTDGEPTDEWEEAARRLNVPGHPSIANTYAIACGPDADTNILHQVTDVVLRMKDMSPSSWNKLFVWLTASVQTTSRALDTGGEGQSVSLPALPDGALEVAPYSDAPRDPRPRQVFLHSYCRRQGLPYLMRYAREPYEDHYRAVTSHPLPVSEEASLAEDLPAINTSLLDGVPACPYCRNEIAAACGCGAILCCAHSDQSFKCPRCHDEVFLARGSHGGGFDVRQSEG